MGSNRREATVRAQKRKKGKNILGVFYEIRIAGSAGGGVIPLSGVLSSYYIRSFGVLFIVSIAASTPIAKKFSDFRYAEQFKPAAVIILLILVTAYLADGSYNPFLYFRF